MKSEQLTKTMPRSNEHAKRTAERTRKVFTLRVGEGVRIGAHVVEVRRVGHRPELAVCGPVINDLFDTYPDWERNIDSATLRVLFAAPASVKLGVRGRMAEQLVRPIYRPESAAVHAANNVAASEARADATPNDEGESSA